MRKWFLALAVVVMMGLSIMSATTALAQAPKTFSVPAVRVVCNGSTWTRSSYYNLGSIDMSNSPGVPRIKMAYSQLADIYLSDSSVNSYDFCKSLLSKD